MGQVYVLESARFQLCDCSSLAGFSILLMEWKFVENLSQFDEDCQWNWFFIKIAKLAFFKFHLRSLLISDPALQCSASFGSTSCFGFRKIQKFFVFRLKKKVGGRVFFISPTSGEEAPQKARPQETWMITWVGSTGHHHSYLFFRVL